MVKEKGKSAQIVVSRELEPQIQEDAGNRVIVDEIRTEPIEKKEAGKYYRLKTKKTKKESLLEEDDKLVTKTEDAAMGIHESVEDEKPLTETEETSESSQKQLKDSQDDEANKAVKKRQRMKNLLFRTEILEALRENITKRKPSSRLSGKVANVGKRRVVGKRLSSGSRGGGE